jgi:hypothetical protein
VDIRFAIKSHVTQLKHAATGSPSNQEYISNLEYSIDNEYREFFKSENTRVKFQINDNMDIIAILSQEESAA